MYLMIPFFKEEMTITLLKAKLHIQYTVWKLQDLQFLEMPISVTNTISNSFLHCFIYEPKFRKPEPLHVLKQTHPVYNTYIYK